MRRLPLVSALLLGACVLSPADQEGSGGHPIEASRILHLRGALSDGIELAAHVIVSAGSFDCNPPDEPVDIADLGALDTLIARDLVVRGRVEGGRYELDVPLRWTAGECALRAFSVALHVSPSRPTPRSNPVVSPGKESPAQRSPCGSAASVAYGGRYRGRGSVRIPSQTRSPSEPLLGNRATPRAKRHARFPATSSWRSSPRYVQRNHAMANRMPAKASRQIRNEECPVSAVCRHVSRLPLGVPPASTSGNPAPGPASGR